MECEFCNYNTTVDPGTIVYEDEEYIAFISKSPVTNGHCVLIAKGHYNFISEIKDLTRLFRFVGYLSQAIKDAVKADHVRLETLYNDNKTGSSHFSMQLIPSYTSDTDRKSAEKISDADVRILENLRKSQWYDTLNA